MKSASPAALLFLGLLAAGCASTKTIEEPGAGARTLPPVQEAPRPAPVPPPAFVYPAVRDGRPAGDLVPGRTTLEGAQKMLPAAPGAGPQKPEGFPEVRVGKVPPQPVTIYEPDRTDYGLLVNAAGLLVMIEDHRPPIAGMSRADLLRKYPALKETDKAVDALEMQGEIAPCIGMIVLLGEPDEKVEETAFAYTCAPSRP